MPALLQRVRTQSYVFMQLHQRTTGYSTFFTRTYHVIPNVPRHPERSEGSPLFAPLLLQEIPHYVRDDVDVVLSPDP